METPAPDGTAPDTITSTTARGIATTGTVTTTAPTTTAATTNVAGTSATDIRAAGATATNESSSGTSVRGATTAGGDTGPDGYEISTAAERVDVDLVYRWLSTDAYWATGRPRHLVEESLANSIPVGVYRTVDQAQVGFARIVTDRATFGWICDVYVAPEERGHGLGTWLAGAARDLLFEIGVKRIILATLDAHGVYAKIGFTPVAHPDRWMEIDRRKTP